MRYEEESVIIRQEEIADDIYSVWIKVGKMAGEAKPGQFVGVYPTDGSMLLPRPISICEIDTQKEALRLVYRVAGKGTAELCSFHAGKKVRVVGPLGNGYDSLWFDGKKCMVVGGGIGIPPMLELAKTIGGDVQAVLGFRDELFLMEEFEKVSTVTVATDTGSAGTKGTVIDAIKANKLETEVIFACGPMPMLKALKAYADENNIACYISLEERMACGIGACLGCVCKTVKKDHHSHVNNARICTEGPVFDAREVEI